MRIAFIHEWLEKYAGAERVLEQLIKIFPDAELFCLVDFLPENRRGFLQGCAPHTSFIQKLPFAKKRFRYYLPLFPLASEQFDLSAFDVIISNSYAFAKGVLVGPQQLHISICCSPIRYAWDLRHQYLEEAGISKGFKSLLVRSILNKIRVWDTVTAQSVDEYVAISHFIAARIKKFYRRDSVVLYPPVEIDSFTLNEQKEGFYFAASRQVPYKKIDIIVEAFKRMPNRKLVVIGDGSEAKSIAKIAKNCPNIQLMGYQPFAVMKEKMQKAKAFLFAAKEDFGIVVLEAQACGTPVLAFGEGGALETVIDSDDKRTGYFFYEQTPEAVIAAVDRFEREGGTIKAADCRANAERFAPEIFRDKFRRFVLEKYEAYRQHSEGIELT
jgi:glycosyltransferase involved in cell wall biosynthesis